MKNKFGIAKKCLAVSLTCSLAAGAGAVLPDAREDGTAAEKTELVVFAAASLTETLTEIAEKYRAFSPDVEIIYTFDSSGTLKTQIEEGAECDVFISAAQKQMDQLDASGDAEGGNEDGPDLVLEGTRTDLLENRVVLVVPEGNPKGIRSYDDLAERLKSGSVLMAMGNEDVPVGQYAQKILACYDLDEGDLVSSGCITFGSNVKEVTTQIAEGIADCGIVYATDAFSAGLEAVDTASAEMCGQIIYPAAVLNISQNTDAAGDFLEYLKGSEAGAVFESAGFTPLAKD